MRVAASGRSTLCALTHSPFAIRHSLQAYKQKINARIPKHLHSQIEGSHKPTQPLAQLKVIKQQLLSCQTAQHTVDEQGQCRWEAPGTPPSMEQVIPAVLQGRQRTVG